MRKWKRPNRKERKKWRQIEGSTERETKRIREKLGIQRKPTSMQENWNKIDMKNENNDE